MAHKVDAHCHYWRLDRGDYGWLRADDPDLAPICRDFGPEDLRPLAETEGVAKRILVQAAPSEAETRFLLDIAAADDAVAGVVGWVDLSDGASVATLETFASDPLFKGVRPMLQDLDDPDWIATRPDPAALDALERLKLRFDALVTPPNLKALMRFVESRPDLPVIIDHAAKPALAAPADDPRRAQWEAGMRDLAAAPQVRCKLSGLLTEMAPADRTSPEKAAETLRPVVGRLLGWFGPDRLAWGSDWPVLTLAAGYSFWAEVTEILLDKLVPADRSSILAGTAERFYGLSGDAS